MKIQMNDLVDNKIYCIPVIQNQQEFLIGVFSIKQVLKFTKFTSRLIVNFDEENKPIYNEEIQRKVENSRVEKIADYLINDPNATFPTNIVLHIPLAVIEMQEKNEYKLVVTLNESVFSEVNKRSDNSDVYISIIDGQHRVRGIEIGIDRLEKQIDAIAKTLRTVTDSESDLNAKLTYFQKRLSDLLNIQLVVSFFIDKPLEYQAMIFSTINRTQKRVSESLVSSLFGLDTGDTPQKTALEVVLTLNSTPESPFYNRIKLYGGSYSNNMSPPLTQAGMVKSIINLISENLREAENDRYRKRKELLKRNVNSQKSLPFRYYYAKNLDTNISDIIYYYFTAVKRVFIKEDGLSYWDFNPDTMEPTNIIQSTVGYQALLQVLIEILKEIKEDEKFSDEAYYKYLSKAKDLNLSDRKRYHFTTRSKAIFQLDLSLKIWPAISNSDPRVIKLNELLEEPND